MIQLTMRFLPLLKVLVGRELTLRYKRSVVGIGWTLLNPIVLSFVLWLIFSYVWGSKLQSNQQFAPYIMAGVLLMNFFNQGVTVSAESIMNNASIITKIYVPPQIFPLAVASAAFINFMIGLIPLTLVCIVSGQAISILIPLVFYVGLCMTFLVAGLGLLLSILYIRFDDMRNIVNVALIIITYFTPVFYPLSILSPRISQVISLNPLNSFLENFRWAFSNNANSTYFDWLYMTVFSIFIFVFGKFIFSKFWTKIVAML